MSKLALEEEWYSALVALRSTRDAVGVLGPLRERGVLGGEDALKLWQLSLQAEDQRRAGGVYYTDYDEAYALAERVLARFDSFPSRVLEPSCGGGNLVAALLAAGVARFGRPAAELASSIHAFELDANGLWLAQWTIEARLGEGVAAKIQWQLADTLEALAPVAGDAGRYTLIYGNPPFGNAIESSTRRSKDERASYAARYPLATRGAFDKCALFVELAAQRCAPDGQISYILPRSWLAQPASQLLRAKLAQDFHLLEIADLPSQAFFDASVATVALTLARRSTSTLPKPTLSKSKPSKKPSPATLSSNAAASRAGVPQLTLVLSPDQPPRQLDATSLLLDGNWGAALHPFAMSLVHALDALPLLATRVEFAAGASTEEAYAWVEHLRDIGAPSDVSSAAPAVLLPSNRSAQLYALAADRAAKPQVASSGTSRGASSVDASDAGASSGGNSLAVDALCVEKPLVIAGMIDPFKLYWGERPTRYLHQDYARPMVALDGIRPARGERSATARTLLPTLSMALEAWPDLDGAVMGAVSTISAWVRIEAINTGDAAEPALDFTTSAGAVPSRSVRHAPTAIVQTPSLQAQRQTLLLSAILNSAWVRLQYACFFGALALNGGNTQVSKNKLGALRAPEAWLTLLDAPPSPTQDLACLQQRLAALPPTPLSKKLPSLETLAILQTHAAEFGAAAGVDELGAGLMALLEADARTALQAGHLDLILLALAPELPITAGD